LPVLGEGGMGQLWTLCSLGSGAGGRT
jgi:hypothetical protein